MSIPHACARDAPDNGKAGLKYLRQLPYTRSAPRGRFLRLAAHPQAASSSISRSCAPPLSLIGNLVYQLFGP
jgi:hypothetical protein